MYSSAIRSSSAIEMPGSSRSSSSPSVPATTAPAAAISSISRADFRMIMRRPRPERTRPGSDPGHGRSNRVLHALERVLDLRPDLVDRALGVQGHEPPRHAVVLDDRLRPLVVGAQTVGDHLGCVVAAVLLDGAPEQAPDGDVVGEVQEEDRVEPAAELGKQYVHSLRLSPGAGGPVQGEALAGIAFAEPA